MEVIEIGIDLSRQFSLVKAILSVVLGTYLGILAFVFAYVLWQTITIHVENGLIQAAVLAAFAFIATAWGAYAASWFNYHRGGRILGLCVGGSLYVLSTLMLSAMPEMSDRWLPYALSQISGTEIAGLVPPLVAGVFGGWLAERRQRRSGTRRLH
ncbi:MAG: hypothetical protein M0T85_09670 [Dehalococcoidales bacterium]|nr:hypothetical protein [Dehalococcoidales bacterium]